MEENSISGSIDGALGHPLLAKGTRHTRSDSTLLVAHPPRKTVV